MKFIAIGELMLRLSPPNYEKIVTTHNFIVNYGGAEANVAVSLANLRVDSTFSGTVIGLFPILDIFYSPFPNL